MSVTWCRNNLISNGLIITLREVSDQVGITYLPPYIRLGGSIHKYGTEDIQMTHTYLSLGYVTKMFSPRHDTHFLILVS